ncbi:MAG: sigma-70 family RNA polymerase sigma factor [Acidobacteriota bacterium]
MSESLINEGDWELILASGAGNHEAFRLLVEKYQRKVFQICLGFVREPQDAENLTQDVFFQIYKNAGRFQGKSKVSTWIYRIAANRSLNLLRHRRAREWLQYYGGSSRSPDPVSRVASRRENPDALLERRERQEIVRRALQRLPSRQRVAFILHNVEGISHEEIASIAGCSVSAVESRIHRAKLNLREHLVHLAKKGA